MRKGRAIFPVEEGGGKSVGGEGSSVGEAGAEGEACCVVA